jgi:hypothetical protein
MVDFDILAMKCRDAARKNGFVMPAGGVDELMQSFNSEGIYDPLIVHNPTITRHDQHESDDEEEMVIEPIMEAPELFFLKDFGNRPDPTEPPEPKKEPKDPIIGAAGRKAMLKEYLQRA